MDIYEALKSLSFKKQAYFKWRFNLEWDQTKPKHTEARLCEVLGVKSLNEYKKWEKTNEFLRLTNLVLETQFANDLEKAYTAVSKKAAKGDEKAIKTMMELQKQITSVNQASRQQAGYKGKNQDAYADLEID